jgi:hypothetical protein
MVTIFVIIFPDPCQGITVEEYLIDPINCRGYIYCYPGLDPIKGTCPAGTSFNLATKGCQSDPFCA